jgi:hypothetical protein
MPEVVKKIWKLGDVILATPSMVADMKTWTPVQASRWKITPGQLAQLKNTGFKQSDTFGLVKDPNILPNIPEITARIYDGNYILKEADYHKLEPYVGCHPIFASLLHKKSKLYTDPKQKILPSHLSEWVKGAKQPYVSPDKDYGDIYQKLTITQDEETLRLSAQLGWMHGCGELSLKSKKWTSHGDYPAFSQMTDLVPQRLLPPQEGKGVDVDLDFWRFIARNHLAVKRGDRAFISLPEGMVMNLYGENKNTFLAHALYPCMKIRTRLSPTLGLCFPTLPRAPNHETILLSLLEDMDALPCQAYLSLDKTYLLKHLEDKGIAIDVSTDKERYALFIYPPHGMGEDKYNNEINCSHLKNLFEKVLPYSHYMTIDYDSIKAFQEKANAFGKGARAGSPKEAFMTAMDELGPLSFPELPQADARYGDDVFTLYTPLWMKA